MNNIRRFKIQSGKYSGQIVDGFMIGIQNYPDQIKIENLNAQQIQDLWKDNKEGFWYPEENVKISFEERIKHIGETIDYGNVEDLVIPFDSYGVEIFNGDTLYVASKNVVRRAVVTKIAPNATMASYGVINRKITVKCEDDGQTLVINNSRDTVKIASV